MVMKTAAFLPTAVVAGILGLVSCSESDSGTPEVGDRTVYEVKGVIRKIKADEKTLVIDHEEIPGYMEAMAMPFQVKDESLLHGFQAGDRVEFEYVVTEEASWIELMTRAPEPEG